MTDTPQGQTERERNREEDWANLVVSLVDEWREDGAATLHRLAQRLKATGGFLVSRQGAEGREALVEVLGREALGDLRGIQTQDLTDEHNRKVARRRAENAEDCLRRILALRTEPQKKRINIVCDTCGQPWYNHHYCVAAPPAEEPAGEETEHCRHPLSTKDGNGVITCDGCHERLYPCDDCGALRTKAEGGTTFTVCEECFAIRRAPQEPSEDVDDVGHAICREAVIRDNPDGSVSEMGNCRLDRGHHGKCSVNKASIAPSEDVEALVKEYGAAMYRHGQHPCDDSAEVSNKAFKDFLAAHRSRASKGEALDRLVGLHEGIEIAYVVDGYEAYLTVHDGASTTKVAHGKTIMDALARLAGEDDQKDIAFYEPGRRMKMRKRDHEPGVDWEP